MDNEYLKRIYGLLESGATLGTGAVSGLVGLPYGLYKGVTSGAYGTPEAPRIAAREAQQFMERNTYQPRTAEGQENLRQLAGLLEATKLPPVMPEASLLAAIPKQAYAAQAERAGMAAEKAIAPVVTRTMERGGLPAQLLGDLSQSSIRPMDVWHGSKSKTITELDPSKSFGDLGVSWVTPEEKFAQRYAGKEGKVYKMDLSEGKNFDFSSKEDIAKLKDAAKKVEYYDPVRGFMTLDKRVPDAGDWKNAEDPRLFNLIKDMGYDSVSVYEDGVRNIGVFNPKKSIKFIDESNVGGLLGQSKAALTPVFETGKEVTFPFIKNTEKAPKMSGFGQEIEPAGNYILSGHDVDRSKLASGWTTGEISFKNPLVIDWGKSGLYTEPDNWKQVLSSQYGGKTGKALSRAIAKDGYDGIVTITEYGPSEIVDLSMFTKKKQSLLD